MELNQFQTSTIAALFIALIFHSKSPMAVGLLKSKYTFLYNDLWFGRTLHYRFRAYVYVPFETLNFQHQNWSRTIILCSKQKLGLLALNGNKSFERATAY